MKIGDVQQKKHRTAKGSKKTMALRPRPSPELKITKEAKGACPSTDQQSCELNAEAVFEIVKAKYKK